MREQRLRIPRLPRATRLGKSLEIVEVAGLKERNDRGVISIWVQSRKSNIHFICFIYYHSREEQRQAGQPHCVWGLVDKVTGLTSCMKPPQDENGAWDQTAWYEIA